MVQFSVQSVRRFRAVKQLISLIMRLIFLIAVFNEHFVCYISIYLCCINLQTDVVGSFLLNASLLLVVMTAD